MQLLFKGRNDFEGFARDIGWAAAELLTFNKQNGEFEKGTGEAAHRMKVMAKTLGIAEEELFKMGQTQAKIEQIGMSAKGGIFDKKELELISTFAKFKDGEWKIEAGEFSSSLKDLKKEDLKRLEGEQMTLEKRAKDSRTFDETLQDLILLFKQQLLPFADTLKTEFGDKIIELGDWFKSSEFKDLLNGLVKKLQGFISFLGEWVKDNPVKASIIGGASVFAGVIGKAAMWFANGVSLGLGFRSVAGFGGGGGMPGGGGAGGASKLFNTRATGAKSAMGRLGLSRTAQMGMNFKGAAGSAGAIGGGVLAAGFAGYDEWSENAAMGMSTGENVGRTGAKATGAGLGAWGGAAAGAAIGSVVPIVGTLIGGLIGGVVGSFAGSEVGEALGDAIWGDERASEKAVSSSYDMSKISDGIMFHPNDKFMKVNDAITVAGTSTSGNNKLAQELSSGNNSGEINHSFKDLNIRISVDAPTDSQFWRSVVDQPDIMRRITEAVHISTEEASSGKIAGKAKRKFRS
jgi:hypothetical protein